MDSKKDFLKYLVERQAMFIDSEFEHERIVAQDIMIKPILLYLEDDIEDILEKLQSEEINYCIVVDKNKHFVGDISDEMLLKIIAHTSINEPLVKVLVV